MTNEELEKLNLSPEEMQKLFPDIIILKRTNRVSTNLEHFPKGTFYRWYQKQSGSSTETGIKDRDFDIGNRDVMNREDGKNTKFAPGVIAIAYERVDIQFPSPSEEEPPQAEEEPYKGPVHKGLVRAPHIEGFSYTGEFRSTLISEFYLGSKGEVLKGYHSNLAFILKKTEENQEDLFEFEFDLTEFLSSSEFDLGEYPSVRAVQRGECFLNNGGRLYESGPNDSAFVGLYRLVLNRYAK